MSDESALNLLELIRRELEAEDVHAQLGGKAPDSERVISQHISENWRVVASFEEPVEARQEKLAKLSQVLATLLKDQPLPFRALLYPSGEAFSKKLDEALAILTGRAQATRAVVFDADSPVIWGLSDRLAVSEDVEQAIQLAQALQSLEERGVSATQVLEAAPDRLADLLLECGANAETQDVFRGELSRWRANGSAWENWPKYLLTCNVIGLLRKEESLTHRHASSLPAQGHLARSFANIYTLALIFEGGFSELVAEAALVKALPHIERLVLALPPFEPPPRGGRVIRLPDRR